MNNEKIKKMLPTLTPESARFILEYCTLEKVALEGDTALSLMERARVGRPEWKPPTSREIFLREHPLEKKEEEVDTCTLMPPAREPGEDREEEGNVAAVEEREEEFPDEGPEVEI